MTAFDKTRAECSVMKALEVVGERWTLLIIREAFFGVRRFEDLHQNIGCARSLLSARLATLMKRGVLVKVPYSVEGQRDRYEYRLTEKGRSLFGVILALRQWGDTWESKHPESPPLRVRHRGCGGWVEARPRCEHGHEVTARDTEPVLKGARPGRA